MDQFRSDLARSTQMVSRYNLPTLNELRLWNRVGANAARMQGVVPGDQRKDPPPFPAPPPGLAGELKYV